MLTDDDLEARPQRAGRDIHLEALRQAACLRAGEFVAEGEGAFDAGAHVGLLEPGLVSHRRQRRVDLHFVPSGDVGQSKRDDRRRQGRRGLFGRQCARRKFWCAGGVRAARPGHRTVIAGVRSDPARGDRRGQHDGDQAHQRTAPTPRASAAAGGADPRWGSAPPGGHRIGRGGRQVGSPGAPAVGQGRTEAGPHRTGRP